MAEDIQKANTETNKFIRTRIDEPTQLSEWARESFDEAFKALFK